MSHWWLMHTWIQIYPVTNNCVPVHQSILIRESTIQRTAYCNSIFIDLIRIYGRCHLFYPRRSESHSPGIYLLSYIKFLTLVQIPHCSTLIISISANDVFHNSSAVNRTREFVGIFRITAQAREQRLEYTPHS